MQFVSDVYYIWYNRIATTLGVGMLLAVLFAIFLPGFEQYKQPYGLNLVTGSIASVQVFYGTLIFRQKARTNPWVAGLFSSMLLALNIINLVHNTGQFHSVYLAVWVVQIFLAGLFGLYAMVGYCFFVTIYFLIIETGETSVSQVDLRAILALGASYLAGLVGYAIWRHLYVDKESQKVRQLTGQLQNKEQQAEILIQSITDGMIVITPEGKISLMNPAAARMTEWSVEEASGIDIRLVMKVQAEDGKPIEEDNNPFTKVFRDQQPLNQTLKLTSRGGKQIIISLAMSPVITPKEKVLAGAVAILRDISTERAEENRRAEFISTASHEMRTPVAAIEGYLALALNDKVSSIDSKARSFLEKAHASTQHLGKLFQDLLTSAKAEDGRLVSHPTVVEMGSFLEQLSDSLRFTAEKKGLLVDFILGASQSAIGGGKVVKPLYYIHVDPDRLREVITNLFDNAVKYTETGKVTLGLTGDKDVVQIHVKDTGPGIAPEDIPHLFQKFYRVDNSATRTIGGTGLGLFICRKIIELYKGRIWVESELGKGSTFYINLPRLSTQQAMHLQAEEAAQIPGLPDAQ